MPQSVIDSENIINFEKNLDSHWKDQDIYFDNYEADINLDKWIVSSMGQTDRTSYI